MKRLAAVLGRDVSRSLSPLLHNTAAEALDLPVVYVAVSCPDPTAFSKSVAALRTLGAVGANVTLPYKGEALLLSDRLSDTARAIGAVNSLSFSESGLLGDNTDGPALAAVLRSLGPKALARVQLLGAGGAARGALWALGLLGASEVTVCARDEKAAAGLAAMVPGASSSGLLPLGGATLVVSALPGTDAIADRALGEWVDRSAGPAILDLAYGDLAHPSPLVARARAAGLRADDGREMLLEQAARSLSAWTGGDLSRIRAAMRGAFDSHPGRA